MSELTPWFDGEQVPAREGVYQRLEWNSETPIYSYWDGEHWCMGRKTARQAYDAQYVPSLHPNLPWRGLTSQA